MGRAVCCRCERPEPVCVCSALPPNGEKLQLDTKILVIQHPCECRKKIIGTVPLMQLCLQNCELLVAKGCGASAATVKRGRRGRKYSDDVDEERARESDLPTSALFDSSEQTSSIDICASEIRTDSPHGDRFGQKLEMKSESWSLDGNTVLEEALSDKETLLLYPGPGAVDIETLDSLSAVRKARTLIVVDGTWRQAGRVMREAACLTRAVAAGTVRRVQFAAAGSSGYQFRREPHEHCLSTLESVAYALQVSSVPRSASGTPRRLTRHVVQFLEGSGERERAVQHLLAAFRLMVQLQTRHIPTPRPSPKPPLPLPLPLPPAATEAAGAAEGAQGQAGGRLYALFRTEREARTGATRFEQEGPAWRCNYDDAAAACRQANTHRPRGTRLTVLPWPHTPAQLSLA